jgi:hypothetical protein
MAQISTKFIKDLAVSTIKLAANSVSEAKIRLSNNAYLRARNAANSADVDVVKVDGSDKIVFGSLPQAAGTPSAANDLINKAYADTLSGAVSSVNGQTGVVVLDSDDISEGSTNLYFTNARAKAAAVADSITDGITDVAPSQNAVFDALALKISSSEKGANNGVATLDAGGKIPVAQLPNSVMEYQGTWNASTNSPSLADGTGSAGDVYLVNVAGTQDLGSGSQTFAVGDWVVYSGSIWQKSINSNAVVSVNSQTGVVVLDTDDIAEGSSNKYQKTWSKDSFTLVAGDITNGYIDLAHTIIASSLDLWVDGGAMETEGVNYTVSLTGGSGGVTRVSFAGDLATGGASELVATDVIRVKYQR